MDYSDFDTFFDRALDLSYAHYDRQLTLINRMVKELRPRCAASLGTCASGVPAFEPVCTTDDASVAESAALVDHALERGSGITAAVEEEDAITDAVVDWLANLGLYLMCLCHLMFMWLF